MSAMNWPLELSRLERSQVEECPIRTNYPHAKRRWSINWRFPLWVVLAVVAWGVVGLFVGGVLEL